jgi:hypothetical protein
MKKVKGLLTLALLLFFVASNPAGAAAAARMIGSAITATANGFGAMATELARGEK